jgi:hypothetical protein
MPALTPASAGKFDPIFAVGFSRSLIMLPNPAAADFSSAMFTQFT